MELLISPQKRRNFIPGTDTHFNDKYYYSSFCISTVSNKIFVEASHAVCLSSAETCKIKPMQLRFTQTLTICLFLLRLNISLSPYCHTLKLKNISIYFLSSISNSALQHHLRKVTIFDLFSAKLIF